MEDDSVQAFDDTVDERFYDERRERAQRRQRKRYHAVYVAPKWRTEVQNNNNEEDKDMNNKMGKLNERLMWKEEDTYEAQMRLATASFLAATTVAVGQPALALDFVLVDPSGAFRFVSLKYLIQ